MLGRKTALLIGGNSFLGGHLLNKFKLNKWRVMSIDYSKNDQAEKNILLDHSLQMAEQVKNISEQCTEFTEEFDTILNVSEDIYPKIENLPDNNLSSEMNLLYRANFEPALLLGHLATKHAGPFCFLGFCCDENPFHDTLYESLEYYVSKVGAMHIGSLNIPREDIIMNCIVSHILLDNMDTPTQRKRYPQRDFSTFVPTEQIANLLFLWCKGEKRPENGTFVKFNYENKILMPEII